jgi:ABC-type Fe3+/spermidine/putrescine transport system ATPase subunit
MDELRLENVAKEYAGLIAVAGIDLSISKGEYLFILGPSGSGKSVLLRLIAGLENPTSGSIYIRDVLVDEIPPHKRNIPVVFQNFALFPHLTARENIEYGLRIRSIRKEKRREKSTTLLEMLTISEMASKKPHQLSIGQRQRVGLGRALALEPSILLLDEPLGALDANLHINMQFELKQIQKNLGVTFLQVTHNQSDALAVADRIAVMNRGCLIQIGSPSEIFSAPNCRFVAELLENNNIFSGSVVGKTDGRVEVETRQGRFVVPAGETPPPVNAEVIFVVRHDRLLVGPGGPETNCFKAHFKGRVVRGSLVIYEFVYEDQSFKVETHLSSGLLSLQTGESLLLGWRPSHGHLLPT